MCQPTALEYKVAEKKGPVTPAAALAERAVDKAAECSVTLRHLSNSLIATAMVSVLMLKDAASAATSAIL
jgi:hypothetical protein